MEYHFYAPTLPLPPTLVGGMLSNMILESPGGVKICDHDITETDWNIICMPTTTFDGGRGGGGAYRFELVQML